MLTVSVAFLQLVSQPEDRLGPHLGAKVPVEGSRGSTLDRKREGDGVRESEMEIHIALQCNNYLL